jgi:hypothetical protein
VTDLLVRASSGNEFKPFLAVRGGRREGVAGEHEGVAGEHTESPEVKSRE